MTRLAILSTLFIMLPTGVGATGRVVSTSPEVTELVFQLGGEKSLVGTSQFSDFPPAAKKLPTIGPLFSPGIEKTFRLNPDWIIGDRESANPSFLKTARALNISHTEFALSRPDEILIAAETLSKKLGQNSLPQLFTQAKNCLSKLKAGRKVPFRFIALAWLNPPIIFGSATLLSHFIGLLGGVNAFENSQLRFPQVSSEWLLRQRVDRVYVLSGTPDKTAIQKFGKRYWPASSPSLISLASDHFSRASLTPWKHLAELKTEKDPPLPEECSGI